MEQTDAEAERHVFCLFCFVLFFSRTFWKPLQTPPRRLYIIRMCTLSLNIELLYGTPPLLLWKTVTARVAPKPRRWAAELSLQLTTRGLRSPCSYQSCQQSAFLPSPPPSLHKTQLYTFLCLDRFPRDKLKIICYGF